MPRNSQKDNSVLILIAIIGLVSTAIGAIITVGGNIAVEKTRQEAEFTKVALLASEPTSEEIKFNSLKIQIWAEYDQPSVLVIYDIVLSKAPAKLNLRIPAKTGTLNSISDGNTEITEYESSKTEDWTLISFDVISPNIHFEYYDTAVVKRNEKRLFTYLWTGEYSIDAFSVAVQEPESSTEILFSPPINNRVQREDGLYYFVINEGSKPKDVIFPLTLTYFKNTDVLKIQTIETPASP